jgi:hypothetical protein
VLGHGLLFVRQIQERDLISKRLELRVFVEKNRLMEPRDGGDYSVSEREVSRR